MAASDKEPTQIWVPISCEEAWCDMASYGLGCYTDHFAPVDVPKKLSAAEEAVLLRLKKGAATNQQLTQAVASAVGGKWPAAQKKAIEALRVLVRDQWVGPMEGWALTWQGQDLAHIVEKRVAKRNGRKRRAQRNPHRDPDVAYMATVMDQMLESPPHGNQFIRGWATGTIAARRRRLSRIKEGPTRAVWASETAFKRVKPIEVACPKCGARKGKLCVTKSGNETKQWHGARQDAARGKAKRNPKSGPRWPHGHYSGTYHGRFTDRDGNRTDGWFVPEKLSKGRHGSLALRIGPEPGNYRSSDLATYLHHATAWTGEPQGRWPGFDELFARVLKERPDVRKRVKALIAHHRLYEKLKELMWEEGVGGHTREWNRLEKLTAELWPASLPSVKKDRKLFDRLRAIS